MRDAFIRALTAAARDDARVVFLTADLGYKLFDDFAARYPGRFYNMGVSEANMVSVAAGLALTGWRPVTYSIVPFATVRCLEQIRNDVCNMELPVLVVGVGGGYAYGVNGATHHGVDDVAVMRAQPGMTVLAPCDPAETAAAVHAALCLPGPSYLRLGRNKEPDLTAGADPFELGRPRVLRQGRDITLLACGPVAAEALQAAKLLVGWRGHDPWVLSVHTVKPIHGLVDWVEQHNPRHVFVIEEHGPCGGLAEALAAELADRAIRPLLTRLAAPDRFFHEVGAQGFLRRAAGLDAEALADKIVRRLGGTR
jgi:transketolase